LRIFEFCAVIVILSSTEADLNRVERFRLYSYICKIIIYSFYNMHDNVAKSLASTQKSLPKM